VVAIATWADTLGTAGHMYDRYAVYDKIIHFGGGLAMTAVAADLLFARLRKEGKPQPLRPTLTLAIGTALALNAAWEVYEFLGDRVFSTGRHAGRLDTTYDLIADTAGALIACALLAQIEPRRFARPAVARRNRVTGIPFRSWVERLISPAEDARLRRILLACGVIAPFVAIAFESAAVSVASHYDRIGGAISDLAAQGYANAAIMRVGLVLFGCLVALFAAGLGRVLPGGRGAETSLTAFAGFTVLSALFRDDAGAAGAPRNVEGYLHNACGLLAGAMLLASIILVTTAAARHAEWAVIVLPGQLCTAIMALAGAYVVWHPAHIGGLAERTYYLAALAWLLFVATTALRVDAAHQLRNPLRSWTTVP
jgi:hypothetical protein